MQNISAISNSRFLGNDNTSNSIQHLPNIEQINNNNHHEVSTTRMGIDLLRAEHFSQLDVNAHGVYANGLDWSYSKAQLPKEQVAEPEKPLWTKSSEKFREKFKSTQTEQPEKDQPQQENGAATNLLFFHSMYHMKTWLGVSLSTVFWLKHFM